jgi:hypothetical protein
MCKECERLEERFIAVGKRISAIDWSRARKNQLDELEQANEVERLEQAKDAILGEIMDHQVH